MIKRGPAEDIDDYDEAATACEAYVHHVWSRPAENLKHFLAICTLRKFLDEEVGWDDKRLAHWTNSRRENLRVLCDDIFHRKGWQEKAREGIESEDDRAFWDAEAAARELSIDTWDLHFKRVQRFPLTSGSWYSLMRQTNEQRIDEVLAFAESVLPLAEIGTGPGDDLGLGPGYEAHGTLDWVLQDLDRFPGRGWRLIKAGMGSPVVRNRNMALRALAAWPRNSWPKEAAPLLQTACDLEPDPDIREDMADLLAGRKPRHHN